MASSTESQLVLRFLQRAMQVERKYAHQLRGAQAERRRALRDVLDERDFVEPDQEDGAEPGE